MANGAAVRMIEGSISEPTHEHGETKVLYHVIEAPSLRAAREWVREHMPWTRCQHERDCCGNWYAFPADVKAVGHRHFKRFLVMQAWGMNV